MKLQLLSLLFVFLVGTVQAAESDDARLTDLSGMLLRSPRILLRHDANGAHHSPFRS